MSNLSWLAFGLVVLACLIPIVILVVLDWRLWRRDLQRQQINAQLYEDWATAQRRARLAHLNVPARKGFSAHRSERVAGVLGTKGRA